MRGVTYLALLASAPCASASLKEEAEATASALKAAAQRDLRLGLRKQVLDQTTSSAQRAAVEVALLVAGLGPEWPWSPQPPPPPPPLSRFLALSGLGRSDLFGVAVATACGVLFVLLLLACAPSRKKKKPKLDPMLTIAFRLINKKKDGQATIEEFRAALEPIQPVVDNVINELLGIPADKVSSFAWVQNGLREKALAATFQEMDANADGVVDLQEFQRYVLGKRFAYDPVLTILFKVLDRQGGGRLGREDLKRAAVALEATAGPAVAEALGLKAPGGGGESGLALRLKSAALDAAVAKVFKDADADTDGWVDLDEFQRYCQGAPKLA